MRFPIRLKLALLAGIPVVGAVLLALLIAIQAQEDLRRSAALGSVESLAELSTNVGQLLEAIQQERVEAALFLAAARVPGGAAAELDARRAAFERTATATDRDHSGLRGFFATRDLSRLPERLVSDMQRLDQELDAVRGMRRRLDDKSLRLEELGATYDAAASRLIRATGAMSELTDDGELLRVITSMVSMLQLTEVASQEQALLAHAFTLGDFPPGSYRALVSLITEGETLEAALGTAAGDERLRTVREAGGASRAKALALRQRALDAIETQLDVPPVEWIAAQQARVDAMRGAEAELRGEVSRLVRAKDASARRSVTQGGSLTAAVLIASVAIAWWIGRGVSRGIGRLRAGADDVAAGRLQTRVSVDSRDEIADLASAFNDMVQEMARARELEQEKARLSRELEIAASIQSALLPKRPSHRDFEFAGIMLPADEVGGDYYDVLTDEDERHLWLCIGDVSGHGLQAGVVMLAAQASFATLFRAAPEADPSDVLRSVNGMLHEAVAHRMGQDKYVTCQLLQYRGEGRFHGVGAHEWPIIWRATSGETDVISLAGPWLGIVPELGKIPEIELVLAVGDVLCLYSDGVIESRTHEGGMIEPAGLSRALADVLSEDPSAPLDDVAREVLRRIADQAVAREDDWSILLVRRRGSAAA